MKMNITGRHALITGAGTGIGRAISVRLSDLGCHVTLVGRTKSSLDETASLCTARAECLTCDLTDEQDILQLVEHIRSSGALDILVNNAGVIQSGPMESISTEEFDTVMATNVRAPFLLMRETLPLLRASEAPEIVNICSVVAHEGYPNQSAYVASKHALCGLSKSFANEVFGDGIRVHLISPGGVLTDMVAKVRPDIVGTPMIAPEDIADAVEYLLTHRSDAVCDEIKLHRVTKAPF